jgi:hypothetical protein
MLPTAKSVLRKKKAGKALDRYLDLANTTLLNNKNNQPSKNDKTVTSIKQGK